MTSTQLPVKGLVLAAGLGTRLKPLTQHLPKPLLPFFGPTLLDISFSTMHLHGIKHVAVNSHHLSEQIAAVLRRGFKDLSLKHSHESMLLGTGGAIPPIRPWLGDDHLLIFNSDILCDVNLGQLIRHHLDSGALATMVCLKRGATEKTPIFHDGHTIKGIGKVLTKDEDFKPETTSFTGIHILSPFFMDQIPAGKPFHIIDTYVDLIAKGLPIGIFEHDGLWSDLGIPQDYLGALNEIRQKRDGLAKLRSIYQSCLDIPQIAALAKLPHYSTLDARSELGTHGYWFNPEEPPSQLRVLDNSVVLTQADLPNHEVISHKLYGYGEVMSLG